MQDIDFDLAGARKAGAKPAQLSSYFKSNFNLDFDFDGAYKAGATDNQILSYLNQSYSDLKKKGNSGVESGVKSSPTPSKYTLKEEAPKKQYYSSKLDKGLIFDKEGQLYAPSSEALTKAIAAPAEDLNLKKSTQKDLVEQSRIPEEKPIKPIEEQGLLLNLVSALDKGVAKNLISTPMQALGTFLQGTTKKVLGGSGRAEISDRLIKYGNYLNNVIDELTPEDEAFKNTLLDQAAQALGQAGALILTGGLTGAGKGATAALVSQAPKGAAVTALKTLGSELSAPTAISAGLSMGQAEFDRAIQAGATDDQAFEAFYKNALTGSVLETIPVMQFFKRFNKSTAGGVANYLKTKGIAGVTGGIEEMTTEIMQQIYANKTAKDIYNINQDIFDGVGSSGGIGFGVGFLLNAMGANAKILRKQGKIADAKSIENQIKQFETKLENPASIKVLSTQIANQGSGQNVIANLNQDLANNVITPQEHQEAVNFAQKADAVAPKIPENISPDNKAKSIELLVERNDIKENNEILLQQKQASDEAYHAGINEEIKANDEKIKKINDEVFKIAKEPVVEEVEQPIVEEPVEVVEEQAVVEKPKLADKLSTFKEKYTLISEGAAKAIETKKINQQAGKIVPMNTEAAVLAWLSGNNELSWKAINEAAGRKEQARLNVGKDYSTEEVKLRDYAAKKRNGGVGLRDAAHQIWQDLTKRTGDKNITTRDIEGALLNAIRENPTRIDAAKNLINIAGAEEAPISIEEGVEDFYSRKGEQPTEPIVEQGMPEGGFVPFQEGEEEIPFSVQEIPTDEVNDMKEIVKDLVEEGLNLNAIRNRIAKELGYDSKRLKETVNKAYQEYTKEFTPKEVTTGIIGRVGNFISDLFGGKAEDKVVILKDAQSTFAKAEQLAETGEGKIDYNLKEANEQATQIELEKDKDGNLIAPNGKKSNLNEIQWKLVRTPAFKSWAGEKWQSVLKDDNGEPRVVYHGTFSQNPKYGQKDFYTFSRKWSETNDTGFHFGTKEAAEARIADLTELSKKGYLFARDTERPRMLPVFLKTGNVLRLPEDDRLPDWRGYRIVQKIFDGIESGTLDKSAEKAFEKDIDKFYDDKLLKNYPENKPEKENEWVGNYLKKKGYDAIEYSNVVEDKGKDSYIVFRPEQVKLADGSNTTFGESGDFRFQVTLPNGEKVTAKPIDASIVNGFYSPLELQINQMKADKMPAKQWLDKLKGEEAKWTGLTNWLSQQQGSLSKQEIKDWLQDNQIEINEIVKGRAENLTEEQLERLKYLEQLDAENPGGAMEDVIQDSYDEFLFLLNVRDKSNSNDLINLQKEAEQKARIAQQKGNKALADKYWEDSHRYTKRHEVLELNMEGEGGILNPTKFSNYQLEGEKEDYAEILVTLPIKESIKETKNKFISSHFDEKNILVHLRMNIRKDVQGNKVLFLEEVQSDWGQTAKKQGLQSEDVKKLEDATTIARKDVEEIDKEVNEYYGKNKIKKVGLSDAEENAYANISAKMRNGVATQEEITERNLYIQKDTFFDSQYDLAKRDKEFNNLLKIKGEKLEIMRDAVLAYNKASSGVVPAPFITDTNAWTKLALKVALKEAIKQGADKIAWTTGEQQNKRYDLSKQVDEIKVLPQYSGSKMVPMTYAVIGIKSGQELARHSANTIGELEGIIGKELAKKVADKGEYEGELSFKGDDLKVGGRGMKGFYGSTFEGNLGILGNMAKSLFKQEPSKISIISMQAKIKELQKEIDLHLDNQTYFLSERDKALNNGDNEKALEMYAKANKSGQLKEAALTDIHGIWKYKGDADQLQYSINITPELKAQVEVGLPLFMANPEGDILGFKFQDKIYLNGEKLNPNTPIHEAGHIWTEWVKQFDNKVYQRGIELVKNSEYLKEVKSSKFYQEQAKKLATKEEAELYFQHEALAMAIGDKGAQFVTESKRTSFKEWLDALWTKIRDLAGFKDITAEELQNLTFEEFTKMAVKDILGKQFEGRTLQEIYETLPMGKKLRQNKEEILIRDNFDNIVAELIKNNKIEKIC